MNNFIRILLWGILLGILFVSCNKAGGRGFGVWQSVSDLMVQHPDSALAILEQGCPDTLSEAEKMCYVLLLTQGRDKNYVALESNSQMQQVVAFFDSVQVDKELLVKAHYYLARTYFEVDSLRACIREYLITNRLANESGNHEYVCLSANNLGRVLEKHNLLDEADYYYEQAERIAFDRGDSLRLATILCNLADICIEKGEAYYRDAESLLLKAYTIKSITQTLKSSIINSLAVLYSNMEEYPEAIRWSKYYIENRKDSTRNYGCYLVIGDAFFYLEQNDSAIYYFEKSVYSPSWQTKSGAYEGLARIARKEGRLSDAFRWNDSCTLYSNLVSTLSCPTMAMKNLKEIVAEEKSVQQRKSTQNQKILLCVIIISISFLLIYFVIKHIRSRKQLFYLKQQYLLLKDQLNTKFHEVGRLESLIKECEGDRIQVSILKGRLENTYVEKDQLFNKIIHLFPASQQLFQLLEENRDREVPSELLNDKLWKKILAELNDVTKMFSLRLSQHYPMLTTDDIRFCCLLKMGFKYADIACLLGRTKNMMYKRRDLVIKRMEYDVSSMSFEEFISRY